MTSILTANTILKTDHFPIFSKSAAFGSLHLEGAPHFRSVSKTLAGPALNSTENLTADNGVQLSADNLNVYGVSQPTQTGLLTVLSLLMQKHQLKLPAAGKPKPKLYWFNTREEPVIYIGGKPFVLRESDNPKANITNLTGISAHRLEQLEERLKQDILYQAQRSCNLFLVHDELQDGSIVPCWISTESVLTPRELFESFRERFGLMYYRVPITPDQHPEDSYLDTFVSIIRGSLPSDVLIFNCGLGFGRTTFGMVVGCLIRRSQLLKAGEQASQDGTTRELLNADTNKALDAEAEKMCMLRLMRTLERALNPKHQAPVSTVDWISTHFGIMDNLKKAIRGEYSIILSLASVLDNGSCTKRLIDHVINKCDALLNIREEVLYNRIQFTSSKDEAALSRARGFLERYFVLICFAAYISEWNNLSFDEWLKSRHEVVKMLDRVRSSQGVFRPIDEVDDHVDDYDDIVMCRHGNVLASFTILKKDLWINNVKFISGVANFRQIEGFPLYAMAQPTSEGLQFVVSELTKRTKKIVWINLREEPLVYINGVPYVLRDKAIRLRNLRSYEGINEERLDLLECKLKIDVARESGLYDGKILVHEERGDGIVGVWVRVQEVSTLREVYSQAASVAYYRVPVTAESSPELGDFDEIVRIMLEHKADVSYVVNCQIGLGRSTTGTVIASLILQKFTPGTPPTIKSPAPSLSYTLIHSLIRSLKNGLESKRTVDETIDLCATHINIRNSIEEYRTQLTPDLSKSVKAMKRYFLMIAFQSYLSSLTDISTLPRQSFSQWFKRHLELVNMYREMGHEAIIPVTVASDSEVNSVVGSRPGHVLAQGMILKFDHFPGCHKSSIPRLVEGGPNFRAVDCEPEFGKPGDIYGIAMPTREAIRGVMDKVQRVVWTMLREEPVLYVKGKPYVLRTAKDPLKNLETTGIERDRVEMMEEMMKKDVISEISKNGRVLLHEEESGSMGFRIVPVWEVVTEADIETTAEVFQRIKDEGFQVDYLRVPVTDEQAPIPRVFDLLVNRVLKNANTSVIFNCQMGRGRTTTGMVVAYIMKLVDQKPTQQPPDSYYNASLASSEDEESYLKEGNFRIIEQLLRLLQHGRHAKYLADVAIDKCSHIQNIREAIYEYKSRDKATHGRTRTVSDSWGNFQDAANLLEETRAEANPVSANYLVRYFYLVTFANYLIERQTQSGSTEFESFSVWLDGHREITNIISGTVAMD